MRRRLRTELGRRFAAIAGRLLISKADASGQDAEGRASPPRLEGETFRGDYRRGVAQFQQWGITSVPLPGAEAIYLQVGGSETHLVVIGSEDPRSMPTDLEPGELALWTDEGSAVVVRRGRQIEVDGNQLDATIAGNANLKATGTGKVTVEAASGGCEVKASAGPVSLTTLFGGAVILTGDGGITLNGALSINGVLTINGEAYLDHTHGGVSTGTSSTGGVD